MSEMNDKANPLSQATRQRLQSLRNLLLQLHKAIMDVERAAYEKMHGRVESPHAFLQLLMHDPWFGWFRPISELVVQIDELLDSKDWVGENEGEGLLREVRSLLNPAEEGEEFGVKYRAVLQEDPDIILKHAEVQQLL